MNRHHFKQDGQPKKRYFSRQAARLDRDEIAQRSMFAPQIYQCRICKAFHLGNKEYWRVERAHMRHEENQVGKLVHALRLVLDRQEP